MARIRLRHCTLRFLDGFRASATVVKNSPAPANGDATLGVDLFAAVNPTSAVTIPLGVRFTVAGVNQIYTVTSVTLNDTTGAVNDTPADSDTNLDVDGITGRIPIGTTFTIVGSSLTFTVTGTTETTGDTTNIVFTPAIATATGVPIEDAVITFAARPVSIGITPSLATADVIPAAEAVITILGRALTVKVGDGNITWDDTINYEYEMDRGEIDCVTQQDDEPLSASIDLVYEFVTAVTGSGVPSPEDVLKNRGEASGWITAGADPCEVFAVDVEVDYAPPCAVQHEITTFPEFRWDSVAHNFTDATLSTQGRCKVTEPTVIRRAY